MATTTPNYGWPVPTSTDLVKNGATAIGALGDAIDASIAELKGGTTGQVLSKTSNTDMDFTWVAQDDSNAIQNSIVDAKGDLIAASANDTPARLAVGSNGETLVADSSTATGLKWAKSPNFVGCSVYGASQTITTGTWTAINFNGENIDTNSFHDTVTNNSRITIPAGLGGYYLVTWQQRWDPSGTGNRSADLYKNGTTQITQEMTASSTYASNARSAIISLAAGDYIQMYVRHTNGSDLVFYPRNEEQPFQVQFLGA